MSDATRKTRTIERKLKNVEALPITDENSFYDITPELIASSDNESEE